MKAMLKGKFIAENDIKKELQAGPGASLINL